MGSKVSEICSMGSKVSEICSRGSKEPLEGGSNFSEGVQIFQ